MKYRVTYQYRATVTVDVEADDEKAAKDAGLDEADASVEGGVSLYDWTVRQIMD